MGKWLQKFIPNAPYLCTDSVATLPTTSRASVPDADVFNKKITNLTEAEQEQFEERAAIMEFDANIPRPLAEKYALQNVIDMRRYLENKSL